MATGAKNGLNPAKVMGNSPDNKGFSEYSITSGYATPLFTGDVVKIGSSGTIERATAGDSAIGVFLGCSYTDTSGTPQHARYWPASTVAADAVAKVMDLPNATYTAKANGTLDQVKVGNLYALDIGTGTTLTGRSAAQVRVLAEDTGDVDLDGETDIGANVTGIADNDAFTIKTAQATSATTITIEDGDGETELLAKLNAVDNISASLTSDGYLYLQATDGYSLVIAESTNTPAAALGLTVGTTTATALISAAHVKVVKAIDMDNYVLEVVIANHDFRDDG